MKNLILTLIITLPLTLWGQGWEQTYSEGVGYSIQQTNDEGYIISGGTMIFKLNSNGDTIWSYTNNTQIEYHFNSILQTFDGKYIVSGLRQLESNGVVMLIIKINENGEEVWEQTYNITTICQDCEGYYSEGLYIEQTLDSGFVITGHNNNNLLILLKINNIGDQEWVKTFNSSLGLSVKQTTDNGFIICGMENIIESNSDLILIKTDENGNEIWSQTFGGEEDDVGYSVQQTSDGGYIITGDSSEDIFLLKTDENGFEQWSQTFGGQGIDEGRSIQQTTDGGYVLTGVFEGIYLLKTDENGEEQWSQTFGGGQGYGEGNSVQQTIDGGYILTGQKNGEIIIIKTDGYGNILPYESTLNGCDSVQSLINETYFLESETYTYTLTNVFGGDSVIVQEIEIFNSPENIVIEGNDEVFSSTLESYQITINPNNSIEWNVEGETISEVNGNTIEVLWGDEGIGYVEVTETDNNGCSTTSTLEVTISNEPTNIYEYNTTRKLIKTINLLGQEIKPQTNQPIIEIFDDGSVEKKLIIEK